MEYDIGGCWLVKAGSLKVCVEFSIRGGGEERGGARRNLQDG